MISEAEALARILSNLAPLATESLPIERALHRFAAEPVHSPASLPRFDQSAMDGYALRSFDAPGTLRLVGEQPAGQDRNLRIRAGETIRIFTGAPLPAGADAVVMQEDVEVDATGIRISQPVAEGEFIRRRGGDLCEGQQIISIGEQITAPRLGLLCTLGISDLAVHRRPSVALITTGDEIRPLGQPLAVGEIHDANGPMLAAQLSDAADLAGLAHTPDDPSLLADAIRSFVQADVIVISAGVSVGDHDPVHAALRQLGATIDLWRVAVKPGKPFLSARLGAQQIFALPGNPVSAFVTAHLFVKPALQRLAGASKPQPPRFSVPLGVSVENPESRVHYLRAVLRDGAAFPTAVQQSHALSSLATADVLLRIEAHTSPGKGDLVAALPLNFR